MVDNIDSVLRRGERIEDLEQKTEDLESGVTNLINIKTIDSKIFT